MCVICPVSAALRGVPDLKAELDLKPHEKEEEQEMLLCDLEELDLLGEIFDTLSSHEPCQLYGTRSLDLFGPDSHDFITKVSSRKVHPHPLLALIPNNKI